MSEVSALTLNNATENWRECLLSEIDEAESFFGIAEDVTFYDDVADELAGEVLSGLSDAGVEYVQSYSQSVGSFVIVQRGTEKEKAAFDAAYDAALPAAKKRIRDKIAELAEERAAAVQARRSADQ